MICAFGGITLLAYKDDRGATVILKIAALHNVTDQLVPFHAFSQEHSRDKKAS